MTRNIAHRGASAEAPENTLDAFALAIAQGADMIETDVRLSRDGALVIHHEREAGGAPVGELDLAALRERVPGLATLEEALDAFGARIDFNLELKRAPECAHAGLEERVLAAVRRRDLLGRTLFSGFWDAGLHELRARAPQARIGLLISARSRAAYLERAQALAAEAVHPALDITTRALVDECHARGLRVNVFTVDAAADQRRLIGWGVDGLITNVPARLRALLRA